MATDFKFIPIIDISPLLAKCNDPKMDEDQGVSKVVKQLDQACREAGFFYVKGHGIPDSLVKEVKDVTHKYFDLPYEEKIKIKMSAATGFRGYQRVGENVTHSRPDMHEAIDCYREIKGGMYGALGEPMEGSNKWPDNPSNFKSLLEEYISLLTGMLSILSFYLFSLFIIIIINNSWSLTDLSRNIMRGIALALGGSPDEFDGEKAGDPFWVMRLIGYPGATSANGSEMPENDIGCGAHTDYGKVSGLADLHAYIPTILTPKLSVILFLKKLYRCLLTLVNQDDDIPALQVRNRSGELILAVPIPGTFVCNIGDMLKIWSNGLYESTLHQVINNSPKYRVSVAFFYEPNFNAVVEPLEFCKQKTGGIKKFERAVYGEHLVRKVLTNFVTD
ncbi:hypothetical protein HHK36_002627 [Tetracentron sinense]|uniref:Fe2OG dioxygenase domain-containing protein n=1 Tax=Tetracentron sinense TaxID=13715 RepID=A0A834ZMI6_TETSI|nr:hypothetical protein HHK36_002627 [Tetracentron sinense]